MVGQALFQECLRGLSVWAGSSMLMEVLSVEEGEIPRTSTVGEIPLRLIRILCQDVTGLEVSYVLVLDQERRRVVRRVTSDVLLGLKLFSLSRMRAALLTFPIAVSFWPVIIGSRWIHQRDEVDTGMSREASRLMYLLQKRDDICSGLFDLLRDALQADWRTRCRARHYGFREARELLSTCELVMEHYTDHQGRPCAYYTWYDCNGYAVASGQTAHRITGVGVGLSRFTGFDADELVQRFQCRCVYTADVSDPPLVRAA